MTAVSDTFAELVYPNDWADNYERNSQAYNYQKREEMCVISTTKEKANENMSELIKNEEMAKLKAEKKEAKKKRQKERKKLGKASNTCDAENKKEITALSKTSLNSVSSSETSKTETAANESDEQITIDQEDEADEEFLDINAAFVKLSVKQKKHIVPNKPTVSKPDKVNPPEAIKSSAPLPQSDKLNMNKANHQTAEILGIQSRHVALVDKDFHRAVELLTRAIFLAPDDLRHYLNRSYCYLRLGQYSLALNDAQFAKTNARTIEQFIMALAREGQALRGLQQYHEAENCFEEVLKLEQRSDWVLRELILVRSMQLTSMGFSKISSLKALQQCSSVTDAVTLLTSGNISSSGLESNVNTSDIQDCDGDEVYFSDDESSSTILLSKLVSDISYESSYYKNLRSQPLSSSKAQELFSSSHRSLNSSVSMESLPRTNGNDQWEVQSNSKSIPNTYKPQKPKAIANDSSSIWVGNIDKNITDLKLRELFSRYGPVNYIRRSPDPNKRYVFIDFVSKKAATKALNSMIIFEVNGIKLPVKPATSSVPKK